MQFQFFSIHSSRQHFRQITREDFQKDEEKLTKILAWVGIVKTTYENWEPFGEALEQIQGSTEKQYFNSIQEEMPVHEKELT